MMMRWLLAPLLLLAACAPEPKAPAPPAYNSVSFYFCAHPDDCLLFMNPNLYEDVSNRGNKVVNVFFTSGDAGLGVQEAAGKKTPYYRAREIASLATNRWMADSDDHDPIPTTGETRTIINDKSIASYRYKNATTYFMRLPDGMYEGQGADGTGRQSLAHLKNGVMRRIAAIDNTATYSWPELVATVEGLIKKESAGLSRVTVNVTNIDRSINKADHSDHTYGGMAVMEAISQYPCISVAKFENYITAQKPENLTDKGFIEEVGSFAVMTAAYGSELYDNSWDAGHRINLGRNYFTYADKGAKCSF